VQLGTTGKLTRDAIPRGGALPLLVAASVASGLSEAALLAVVAQLAVSAAASDADHPSISVLGVDVVAPVSTLLAAACVLAVLRLGLTVLTSWLPARLSASAQRRYRVGLIEAFLHASWDAKAREREGALQEALTTYVDRGASAVQVMGNGLAAAVNFLAMLVAACLLNPAVSVAIGAAAVGMFFVLRPLSTRTKLRSAKYTTDHTTFASEVAEVNSLAQEIHVFGVVDDVRSSLESGADEVARAYLPTAFLGALVPAAYQGVALIAAVGGLAIVHNLPGTRLATLGGIVLLMLRALAYSQQVQSAHQQLRNLEPYLARLSELESRMRNSEPASEGISLGGLGQLEFAHLGFRYDDRGPALVDVTATIEPGEAIGIVGRSGAGKSTLVSILLRLRTPTAGDYRINGRTSDKYDFASWWRHVAVVPQDPRLETASVADNIRFHRSWISDADVQSAARRAHVDEEIAAWTEGYETLVSNRAEAISGGQRQRLCIARALAGEPDLLVLDEPTSGLDASSEAEIQASLRELKGKTTLVIVAHRLSTLSLCDRIMVLEDGQLQAFDTAENLEAENAFFRESVRLARVGVDGVRPS
jgi:ABC-type multidrug transport system fused ATPase/permease subunit